MAYHPDAVKLIQEFESCLRRIAGRPGYFGPYLCPARVATIGWGNTRWPDGRKVTMADAPISQARCDEIFASELREDEAAFDRLNTARLHPLMKGALGSFCYNCGTGAYRGSNLRRAVNAGRWQDVPRELAKWRMGGGVVLRGLVRRRAAEAVLFNRGVNALHNGGPVDMPETPVIQKAPDLPPPIPTDTKTIQPPAALWRRVIEWVLK